MLKKEGCWTIPQLTMELEAKVKDLETKVAALETAKSVMYEHNLSFIVNDGSTEIGTVYLTLYNQNSDAFTVDDLTEYLTNFDTVERSATGLYPSSDVAIIAIKEGRVAFNDTDHAAFDTITNLNDTVIQILLPAET